MSGTINDRCDRCGGNRPDVEDRLDRYDRYLTAGGNCPGSLCVDEAGRVVGCGAWSSDAYLAGAARALGARGGRAGRGKSQVRGNSAYYRDLVAQRKDRQR